MMMHRAKLKLCDCMHAAMAAPRERYLESLAFVEGCRFHSREEILAAEVHDREALMVTSQLALHSGKIKRMKACLACTLHPCICEAFRPLRLGHRLWVVSHCKEVLRTTSTGKILLLAHPRCTLLVGGWPSHDARIAEVAARESAVLLYPSEGALTPAELLGATHAAADAAAATATAAHAADDDVAAARAEAGVLDIILVDGTWNQARHLAQQKLPAALRRVAVSMDERSIFGSLVRRQGELRQQAGRVSTVEAYAQLALALGDDASEVGALGDFLRSLIASLPYTGVRGAEFDPELEAPPPRSTTDMYLRRARGLSRALGRGPWREEGRRRLGGLLQSDRKLNGVPLKWRVDESSRLAELIEVTRRGETRVHAAWPLDELVRAPDPAPDCPEAEASAPA